jgi:hypothetical protein
MPVTLVDTGAKTLARRFYRAVGGGSTPPPGSISFSYYVSGGRFFNDVIGMPTFPVRFSCYRVIWEVQDSGTLPPPSEVKFTGPSGSGFNNVPGDFVSTDGQKKYIVSTCAGSATGPTLGTWTILYKGSPVNLTIADPLAMEHLAVPVPAAIVVAGVLKSFGWAYYDVTGVAMAAAPAYVATSQVQVNDKSGNRLYDSPELPGTSLMHILSKGVTWQSVGTVHMAYDDTAGNHYVISFQR